METIVIDDDLYLSTSTPSSSSDGYKDLITCAICMSTLTMPKTLPCLHSFCKSCLKSMCKSRLFGGYEWIENCPTCRKGVHKSVDELPDDFKAKSLIQLLDKSVPAPVITTDDKKSCSEHPNRQCHLLCVSPGCNRPVCSKCCTSTHQGHEFVDVLDDPKEFIDQVRTRLTEIRNAIRSFTEANDALVDHHEDFKQTISNSCEGLKEKVRVFTNELQEKFESETNAQKQSATKELVQLKSSEETCQTLVRDFDTCISTGKFMPGIYKGLKKYINIKISSSDSEEVTLLYQVIYPSLTLSQATSDMLIKYSVLRMNGMTRFVNRYQPAQNNRKRQVSKIAFKL